MCTSMVIAALFQVGKMWKRSKCSLVDKQIKIIYKIYLISVTYTCTQWNVFKP